MKGHARVSCLDCIPMRNRPTRTESVKSGDFQILGLDSGGGVGAVGRWVNWKKASGVFV